MQTNYNFQNGHLYGTGPEQPYKGGYQVPQYQGNIYPNLGYTVQRGVITQDVHHYTLKLLDQAGAVARAITHPVPNGTSSSPSHSKRRSRGGNINIDMSDRSVNILSSRTTVVNNHGRRSEKEDDSAVRIFAAIAGIIALIGGAILLGKLQSKNENLDKEISKFEKQANIWSYHRQAYAYSPDYERRVNKIVELTRGIMTRNKRDIKSTILKVVLPILFAGGALFGGAVLGGAIGSGLMIAGAVTLVGAAVFAIYKAVRNANSNVDSDAAKKILKNIEIVQRNTTYVYACEQFRTRMSFDPQYQTI